LAHLVVDAIIDKKGSDILLLDIRGHSIITDFFVLCNGDSIRQLKALTSGVTQQVKEHANEYPMGVEGVPESGWMLVDFGDVIVHIFAPEKRRYYNLEELWGDGHVVVRVP